MNQTELQNLQQRLAYALKLADEAKAQEAEAKQAYDEKLQTVLDQFEKDNPELVKAKMEAETTATLRSEQASRVRQETVDALEDHFITDPTDKKPVEGFGMRMEKEPVFDDRSFLKDVIQAGATFLLQLNGKAIKQFVVANAEKDGECYKMPDYLRTWLPALDVKTVYKPTISRDKLVKVAPEFAPVTSVTEKSDIPF